MAKKQWRFYYEVRKLGKYFKELREDMNLSIREVGRRTDLTPGYLSRLESGQVFKSISIETLVLLSEVYKIPVSQILEETGFIKKETEQFPEFDFYLRSKYKLPPQAIRDLKLAKELIENKYKKI